MEYLAVGPSETVYIGDSDVDIMTAANAGCISVSVGWGYQSEERLISADAKRIYHNTDKLCRYLRELMIEH